MGASGQVVVMSNGMTGLFSGLFPTGTAPQPKGPSLSASAGSVCHRPRVMTLAWRTSRGEPRVTKA
eukprot:1551158-Rhodomonas_salina.3